MHRHLVVNRREALGSKSFITARRTNSLRLVQLALAARSTASSTAWAPARPGAQTCARSLKSSPNHLKLHIEKIEYGTKKLPL